MAAQIADRIAVLYAGRIAEIGPTAAVLATPAHPYTHGLLALAPHAGHGRERRLAALAGSVPSPVSPLPGCAFVPRCALATDDCSKSPPDPIAVAADRVSACIVFARRGRWRTGHEVDEYQRAVSRTGHRPRRRAAVRGHARRHQDVLGSQALAESLDGQPRQTSGTARSFADASRTANRSRWSVRAVRASRRCCGSSRVWRNRRRVRSSWPARAAAADGVPGRGRIADAMAVGRGIDRRAASRQWNVSRQRAATPSPRCSSVSACRGDVAKSRAGQLSGGQRQRVSLARATVVPPSVLLCDEPTSALDVSLAASVLNLIGDLRRTLDMSVVFVTHDLSVARVVADRIAVMYLGRIVEIGPAERGHRRSRAPVHAGAGRFDPRPRSRIAGVARRTRQPAVAADGLRVPPALSDRHRHVLADSQLDVRLEGIPGQSAPGGLYRTEGGLMADRAPRSHR